MDPVALVAAGGRWWKPSFNSIRNGWGEEAIPLFLSAAKPTDQGEESVVLLVVVVVGGGTIFKCPMYSFLRCEK